MVIIVPFPCNDSRPDLVDGFIVLAIIVTFFLFVPPFGMALVIKGPDAYCPETGSSKQAAG
jgi:hypothetical protein